MEEGTATREEGGKKDQPKRGRPTILAARERTWSSGNVRSMDEYIKRKRDANMTKEGKDEEAFKRSKLTKRSLEERKRQEENSKGTENSLEKEKSLEEKLEEVVIMIKRMEDRWEGYREEVIKWKIEQQEREERGRKEREEMRVELEELRRRIDNMEKERERDKKEEIVVKDGRKGKIEEEIETKIIKKSLEKWKEEEERQRRKRNIIIKGVGEKEKIEEIVSELWGMMEVKGKTEEVKEIGRGNGRRGRMILVRMENREGKIEVMKKKNKLKERMERLHDDWTWKERAMQWKLERIAWEERKRGKTAWVRYGKIWREDRWWRWNEDEEKLMEGDEEERGKKKEEGRGEERGGSSENGKIEKTVD